VSIHQIRCRPRIRITLRGRDEFTPTRTLQLHFPHQTLHALATDVDALSAQLPMNPRASIGLVRASMDRLDRALENQILPFSFRHRTSLPGMEATAGDLQQPAHRPNRMGGLIHLHESEECLEFGTVSCANQAAAFERISRSTLSWRFSRRSPRQLLALARRQSTIASPGVAFTLLQPTADGPTRATKLSRQLRWLATGTYQLNHLPTEFRRISNSSF